MNALTDIFTDPRPCAVCRGDGPTYADRETGVRYCLPCLETAVNQANAEATNAPDVDDVLLAFDQAQDAAPDDRTLLRRFTQCFPQFADDLIAVSYAGFALGMTLHDPLEEGGRA